MLIRLETDGVILHEVAAGAVEGEILIGRSKDCDWRTPETDGMISARHATIYRKGRAVWIKDGGSTNGTFIRGKRIVTHRLSVGDQLAIGGCLLTACPDRKAGSRPVSEIVCLTGNVRHPRHAIRTPSMVIGSDPQAAVLLLDPLVSRQHAEIVLRDDGGCWIKDLKSRNGTWVNGERLIKERLLKHGDRITLAHVEFEFRDGSAKRANSHAWLRLGIMVLTLLLVAAAYGVFQRLKPSAEFHLSQARRCAAAKDFEAARKQLAAAREARRGGQNQIAIRDLERLLSLWVSTVATWGDARAALAGSDWTNAARLLGALQGRPAEAWSWNEQAVLVKEEVALATEMLEALTRGEALVQQPAATVEELARAEGTTKAALARGMNTPSDHLAPLCAALKDLGGRIAENRRVADDVEAILNRLKDPQPAYRQIVEDLTAMREQADSRMKPYLQRLLTPIVELSKAYAQLESLSDHIHATRFEAVRNTSFALPPAEMCALDARISSARLNLEDIYTPLRAAAGRVDHLWGEIGKHIQRGGMRGLDALEDPAVLARIFACDSLGLPYPSSQRTSPAGDFDRVLGVEEFYARLRELPENTDVTAAEWPVDAWLTQTREMALKIEALDEFLRQPKQAWMSSGALVTQMRRFREADAKRQTIAESMLRRAESTPGREGLIAGGIAWRLWTKGELPLIGGKPLIEWLAARLHADREPLLRLRDEYGMASLTRKIEIRTEILKLGIPGDPLVRPMWIEQAAAR